MLNLHIVRMGFKYLVSVLVGLLFFIHAVAQESIDVELSRYEMVCGMCMDLKTRISAGEQVSKDEATSMINVFVGMNRKLKALESQMTALQRRKFEAVGKWFSTGVRPELPESLPDVAPMVNPPEVVAVLQDTVDIIYPSLSSEPPVLAAVEAERNTDVFLTAELFAPSMAYGLRAGVQFGRFGGYVSFRSDFHPDEYEYTCLSDGTLQGGGSFWGNGESRSSNMSVNVGLLVGAASWLTFYAGVGYGYISYMQKDIDGVWAQVSDLSCRGLSAEAGTLLSWHKLVLSAGVSTISFRTAGFVCGIGVRF